MSFEALGDGWYRIMDYVSVSTASAFRGVAITDTSGVEHNPSVPAGSYVYLWGGQGENSATYATSYIPNYGTTAGVTRVADACSKTGISSLIGQTEGTLFVETESLINGIGCRFTLSDGTISNRVSIEWDEVPSRIKGFLGSGGNTLADGYDQTNRLKIALTYNASAFKMFINGVLVDTDSSIPTVSGMDRVEFSNYGGVNYPFLGSAHQLLIFTTALSDAEAITLTTL
jgi:hypothetical protein